MSARRPRGILARVLTDADHTPHRSDPMLPTMYRRALCASFFASSSLHATAAVAAAATALECSPRLSVDERAQCVLATPAGKRALAAVGEVIPAAADLAVKQAHAALTPSFARFVIRQAGVAAAQEALSRAAADAFPRHTGRTLAQWRADWVAAIGGGVTGG